MSCTSGLAAVAWAVGREHAGWCPFFCFGDGVRCRRCTCPGLYRSWERPPQAGSLNPSPAACEPWGRLSILLAGPPCAMVRAPGRSLHVVTAESPSLGGLGWWVSGGFRVDWWPCRSLRMDPSRCTGLTCGRPRMPPAWVPCVALNVWLMLALAVLLPPVVGLSGFDSNCSVDLGREATCLSYI